MSDEWRQHVTEYHHHLARNAICEYGEDAWMSIGPPFPPKPSTEVDMSAFSWSVRAREVLESPVVAIDTTPEFIKKLRKI